MPFRKFRIFDVKEHCLADDVYDVTNDGTLYIGDHRLIRVAKDGELNIQYQTPFTDKEGNEIWQGDILHCDHAGQDSATQKSEGHDYLVNFDEFHGAWAIYSYDAGFKMMVALLFQYAKKGTVKK